MAVPQAWMWQGSLWVQCLPPSAQRCCAHALCRVSAGRGWVSPSQDWWAGRKQGTRRACAGVFLAPLWVLLSAQAREPWDTGNQLSEWSVICALVCTMSVRSTLQSEATSGFSQHLAVTTVIMGGDEMNAKSSQWGSSSSHLCCV